MRKKRTMGLGLPSRHWHTLAQAHQEQPLAWTGGLALWCNLAVSLRKPNRHCQAYVLLPAGLSHMTLGSLHT